MYPIYDLVHKKMSEKQLLPNHQNQYQYQKMTYLIKETLGDLKGLKVCCDCKIYNKNTNKIQKVRKCNTLRNFKKSCK